jgi:rod shape-determining protein MreB
LKKIFSQYIALDLGTTNTLIYMEGQDVVVNEPSVIAVGNDDRVEAVGEEARAMLGRTPPDIRAIRPLNNGVISDYQTTELMLKELFRMAFQGASVVRPRVLCCVPSGTTEVERRAIRDSVKNAGGRGVYIIEEPIAAAIGMRLPIEESIGSIVVDVGGGTTEVAVMSLGGVVVSESRKVGGDNMDAAIERFMRNNYNLLVGEQICEKIKIQIGSAIKQDKASGSKKSTAEEPTFEVRGRNLVSGIPATITLSAAEARQALEETVSAIVGTVSATLEKTPPELASDLVDAGINLTGGGALLHGLDRIISRETGLTVKIAKNPQTTIIEGLGIILSNFRHYRELFSLSPS